MIMEKFALLGGISSIILFSLNLLPYTLMWVLFTFLYIFMPNTKVRFFSGLFAGILTGTIFQIVQWAYITFQIGVVHYNAIYGSFAALPLFLAWIQLSWLIVLFGAELSVAYQNADDYEFEPDVLHASRRLRNLLSLLVTSRVIKNFTRGEKPMSSREISNKMGIPRRLVREIIFDLVESKIVSIVETGKDKERGYQPAVDTNIISIHYVLDAIENKGVNKMPCADNTEIAAISASLETFGNGIEKLPENKLLKEI
jgi:membrane protein